MKYIIFGDIFSKPFSLLKDNNIIFKNFDFSTAKNLINYDNKTSHTINEIVDNLNENDSYLMFLFGHIDLYLSYYTTIFVDKSEFIIDDVVKNYIEFINSIKYNNKQKYVLSIFPPFLKDVNVIDLLIKYRFIRYHMISDLDKKIIEYHTNLNNRLKLFNNFNDLLKVYCDKYGINFIDTREDVLNKNGYLKDEYIQTLDDININLLWEPLIILLSKRLKKYGINLNINTISDLSLNKYIEDYSNIRKSKINRLNP